MSVVGANAAAAAVAAAATAAANAAAATAAAASAAAAAAQPAFVSKKLESVFRASGLPLLMPESATRAAIQQYTGNSVHSHAEVEFGALNTGTLHMAAFRNGCLSLTAAPTRYAKLGSW
ncbi:hypothetical protein T492DRAFT_878283 [Pavlovales sp. CCMP2436]|nr:hypothetical protein T492DRAFT_878283 [Pavlovales sp. CCMP2436]